MSTKTSILPKYRHITIWNRTQCLVFVAELLMLRFGLGSMSEIGLKGDLLSTLSLLVFIYGTFLL